MAYTTAETLPHSRNGLKALLAYAKEWTRTTRSAIQAAERVRELSEKTDQELQAMGLSRSDIAQEGLKVLNSKG